MMEDTVQVCVRFTKVTDDGVGFTDALYYDLNEYAKVDPGQVEAAKQERFDEWVEAVKNAPVAEPLSDEQALAALTEQVEWLTAEKESLVQQVVEVSARVEAAKIKPIEPVENPRRVI